MPDPRGPTPVLESRTVSPASRLARRVARRALAYLAPPLAIAVGILLAVAKFDGPSGNEVGSDSQPPNSRDPMRVVGLARTDAGRPVELFAPRAPDGPDEVADRDVRLLAALGYTDRVVRTGPPSEASNCLGWAFTGGRFWIEPADAERILFDNGYHPATRPECGDLAVYRQSGMVVHVGIVRTTGADAADTIIEGKWGWMGVFRHRAGDCYYGPGYTFIRSSRRGHLLAGLPPAGPMESSDTSLTTEDRPAGPVRGHGLSSTP